MKRIEAKLGDRFKFHGRWYTIANIDRELSLMAIMPDDWSGYPDVILLNDYEEFGWVVSAYPKTVTKYFSKHPFISEYDSRRRSIYAYLVFGCLLLVFLYFWKLIQIL